MCFWKKESIPAYLIGLYQALGVVVYCSLVATLMHSLNGVLTIKSELLTGTLMLTLFVFSAALMSATVFGVAVHLTINNNIKKAIGVVVYTLLWVAIFFGLVVGLVVLFQ